MNGQVVLAGAGDGASVTLTVPPGSYDLTEVAAAGTNAGDYRSIVECKRGVHRRQLRAGTVWDDLTLPAGARAVCTFRNIRPLRPRSRSTRPPRPWWSAGRALSYTLYVTNPGDVPVPEGRVQVDDPQCDAPPSVEAKASAIRSRRLSGNARSRRHLDLRLHPPDRPSGSPVPAVGHPQHRDRHRHHRPGDRHRHRLHRDPRHLPTTAQPTRGHPTDTDPSPGRWAARAGAARAAAAQAGACPHNHPGRPRP